MWEDQPQHAKYCTILSNILYSNNMGNGPGQPIVLVHKMNGSPDETGWAALSPCDASRYTEVHVEHNFKKSVSESASNTPGDPKFASSHPTKLSDFELAADSPMWALGFQRIPIEKIGYFSATPPQNPVLSSGGKSSNASETCSSSPNDRGSRSRRASKFFATRRPRASPITVRNARR